MPAMKWWGWGEEGVEFSAEDKPALAPFIAEKIAVDIRARNGASVRFDELAITEPTLPSDLHRDLEQAAGPGFVSTDRLDRVVHGAGQPERRVRWRPDPDRLDQLLVRLGRVLRLHPGQARLAVEVEHRVQPFEVDRDHRSGLAVWRLKGAGDRGAASERDQDRVGAERRLDDRADVLLAAGSDHDVGEAG